MPTHPVLFVTHRGLTHQNAALQAAPPELSITMLRSPEKAELMEHLAGQEYLITERAGEIDAEILSAARGVRLIQRLGSQTWDIDLEAARAAGIPVCYRPVHTCVMVAEHMLVQMLALAKRLREVMHITVEAGDWGQPPRRCDEDYFAYNWSGRSGVRGLYRSTVGIVGFGEIGAELARRLRNFGCRVLYNKRSRLPHPAEVEMDIEYAGLDELLAASDYVCMLLPFFPETEKLVNADFIGKMKPGAILASAGASGVLDEDAVAAAVKAGRLGGVATDTYAWEPVRADNPLLALAADPLCNLLLTPHTAAGTEHAGVSDRYGDYENLLRHIQGEPLLFRL
ncbi:MAG: hypothetical protein GYA17_21410, partial [Chloroflexi bacterium]|nr:hypothetical protein [Chloroflexota bacterium]